MTDNDSLRALAAEWERRAESRLMDVCGFLLRECAQELRDVMNEEPMRAELPRCGWG